MKFVYIIGTCDTKSAELNYLQHCITQADKNIHTRLVDVGTTNSTTKADISAKEIASYHPEGANKVLGKTDRGVAVTAMSKALEAYIISRDDIAGIIGIGGSGGTALITPAMRAISVGVPKLMVSTMASGDVAPYVGPTDICMMHSVVDVAGLNPVLKQVLSNAGTAIAGMAGAEPIVSDTDTKPSIGLSMFGVTTTCVNALTRKLDDQYNCLVFHATGTGGQSMEKLVESGGIGAVLDITTTEVGDLLVGGVLACLPTRLDVFAEKQIPYIGSVGAVDMINFGGRESVPEHFFGRTLYEHNAQVTLMRTSPEENTRIGIWIAEKLNKMTGPVRFLLPLKGVSAIDAPGMPFYDPIADAALFSAIKQTFQPSENRQLIPVDANINDDEFAAAALAAFADIT